MIDSFRFLPRSFAPLYDNPTPLPGEDGEVWAPLAHERRVRQIRARLDNLRHGLARGAPG